MDRAAKLQKLYGDWVLRNDALVALIGELAPHAPRWLQDKAQTLIEDIREASQVSPIALEVRDESAERVLEVVKGKAAKNG